MTALPGLPLDPACLDLAWLVEPASWAGDGSTLTIEAGPRTDWFVDPSGAAEPALNAPALVGPVTGDFLLGARVTVAFGAKFDAGALMLHADERCWAKLCFELSPQAEPMVVSVVTRGASDDCNSMTVDGGEVWLRVARLGSAYAFHASTDGARWSLVRHFSLPADRIAVGFEAQSPAGGGCSATFTDIRFESRLLGDIRSGE